MSEEELLEKRAKELSDEQLQEAIKIIQKDIQKGVQA